MSLDDAIDALDGPGIAKVPGEHGDTEIDVVEADKLGVRIRGVRVGREPRDIAREADRLTDLRGLPERVAPSEVAPELGGAILRTVPEQVDEGYFEVDIRERETSVRRIRVDGGERSEDDFVVTRRQLERLVDELA